ncbi:MAG TPA: ABC transporter ATP-binding protein, partial [Thermoanaerobaculia bacterium]|nr:ABC transporter ATP-binding protein [Thermoanaerobaculia bacterium]
MRRLRQRQEWQFFAALPRADRPLAVGWWAVLVARGLLPALFAVAMGALVGAVARGEALGAPLALAGAAFVLLQVLAPIHQALSYNLGDRTAAWLYDRLTDACVAPPGVAHLEDPKLGGDLVTARDFDLGMTGPPLFIDMDFIADGLVQMLGGLASAAVLFAYAWWAPPLLAAAWLATHWLLRESAVWFDRRTEEVRSAQRDADYAYRIAVDPPAAKELRLFGLATWVLDWFVERRTKLHRLQYEATRLREKSVLISLLLAGGANVIVFWSIGAAVGRGDLGLGAAVTFAQAAVGASMIAFGGLNWSLDGASAPVAAVARLQGAMAAAGALPAGGRPAAEMPAREVRFRDVTFAYPGAVEGGGTPVLAGFDLTIPAGSSLAIVGQNGAGKTT